jgi:dTDP-4-amino-4,6-dideoxygalactose transaminase
MSEASDLKRRTFLVFGSPDIRNEDVEEVIDSLCSGWVGTGPKVQRFEAMLSGYLGVPEVRCLASCTAALFLAMRALGVGPGDEVIVPAMTFVASANAVEHVGARPVLVDVELETGLIDLDAAEAAIGPHTRAIMPVHLAGRPANVDRVNALRDQHGIAVIEDAAHAIGAEWRGRKVGDFGNVAAFSFYVTKNITTVEGGALALRDTELAERIERLALHGLSLGAWQRFSDTGFRHYEVTEPGFKFNMTDIQAALGIHQLARLDEGIDRRAAHWEAYDRELADLPVVTPPPPPEHVRHARHLYQVRLAEDAPLARDSLVEALNSWNIGTGVHYRGVHLHPYYRDRYQLDPAALPNATAISNTTVSLPLSSNLTDRDRRDVVAAMAALLTV